MLARMACCFGFFITAMAAVAQPPAKPPAAPAGAFQISGTLVDSTNDQPLAHARVAIAPVSDRSAFTAIVTSDDGRFVFRRLAAGKYTLTAQRRGYLTQSFNQHDQFSSSIAVGAGLDSGDLVFRLAPEAAITGVITDEVGDPVRQAQVLLFQAGIAGGADGVRLRNRTVTDDEGAYRFGHLMPGKYLVAVSAKPWYAQPAVSPDAGGHQVFQPQGSAVTSRSAQSLAPLPVDEKTAALDLAYPITFYPGATDPGAGAQIPLALGEKAIANVTLQPIAAAHFRVWRDEKA
ncbi:MAG: carboxypeptidase regulatory-like domain-containing protein, partial [Terriglobales bacterium]